MINQLKKIEKLLEQSEWTPEERQWLLNLLKNSNGADLKKIMQDFFSEDLEKNKSIAPVISEKLLNGIYQKIGFSKERQRARLIRMWTLRAAAACFVGFFAFGTLLWLRNNSKQPRSEIRVSSSKKYKNDIVPGGNKAMLTLDDGSTIVLGDAKSGLLAHQGSTKIIKEGGRLDYNSSGYEADSKVMYNTISTPGGGQYQVELPDGSKVWLNAVSSLRFPTIFSGKERRVEMSGEAYFEIAKDAKMPFIVSANGAEVKVLGTHFNVMAYEGEPALNTTLLEGSVQFIKENNTTMLRPGEQLQLAKTGNLKIERDVDLTEVTAWKNGFFDFNGLDFEAIARQLSRWYNVEVIYSRKVDDLFYAKIPRNTKLSDVLEALELTGKIHFEIEAKKIIVLP